MQSVVYFLSYISKVYELLYRPTKVFYYFLSLRIQSGLVGAGIHVWAQKVKVYRFASIIF